MATNANAVAVTTALSSALADPTLTAANTDATVEGLHLQEQYGL